MNIQPQPLPLKDQRHLQHANRESFIGLFWDRLTYLVFPRGVTTSRQTTNSQRLRSLQQQRKELLCHIHLTIVHERQQCPQRCSVDVMKHYYGIFVGVLLQKNHVGVTQKLQLNSSTIPKLLITQIHLKYSSED